jgi:hypothetical protein
MIEKHYRYSRIKHTVTFILTLLICSCNSDEKDIIRQIDQDFSIIKDSQNEIIDNFEYCLSNFSDSLGVVDNKQRIFCNLSKDDSEHLGQMNLLKTKSLINSGYEISVDVKNSYRFFYKYKTVGYIAGVIKYGLLYSDIQKVNSEVYSLRLEPYETLKTIDSDNLIIKINEYAE